MGLIHLYYVKYNFLLIFCGFYKKDKIFLKFCNFSANKKLKSCECY